MTTPLLLRGECCVTRTIAESVPMRFQLDVVLGSVVLEQSCDETLTCASERRVSSQTLQHRRRLHTNDTYVLHFFSLGRCKHTCTLTRWTAKLVT